MATPTGTVVIRPQPGAQERFLSTTADIAIYGGAAGGGKSYAALLEPLRHAHNPRFEALILRRTTPEITNPGGLWSETEGLYPLVGATPRIGCLDWKFPSGAKVSFDHLEHEKSKHKYQGAQIPLITFDELTHFTEGQFWYMVSRNRSTCGVRPYIRGTCNPDASSFVRRMIDWWIDDDTGYAIPQRSGVVRYFVRFGGELQWADSPAELAKDFPDVKPTSFTFVPATLADNPALTSKDPDYLGKLQALPYVDRERLLGGNWNVTDGEGAYFPAHYFDGIYTPHLPDERLVTVVAFDPSMGKKDGPRAQKPSDYQAFVAVALGHDRRYYVDAHLGRWTTRECVEQGIQWMTRIRPDAFGVETLGFQQLFGDLFLTEVHRLGLNGVFPLNVAESPGMSGRLPKKEVRIKLLTTPLADGRVKFVRSPGTSLLLEQLRAWPMHNHDDGPDALEMAIRFAEHLANGVDVEPEPELLTA